MWKQMSDYHNIIFSEVSLFFKCNSIQQLHDMKPIKPTCISRDSFEEAHQNGEVLGIYHSINHFYYVAHIFVFIKQTLRGLKIEFVNLFKSFKRRWENTRS